VIVVLVESLVAFGWMLRVGQKVFLGPWSATDRPHLALPRTMRAALVLLIIGCLVAPAVGIPLVHRIAP
jgi:NADH:ubiquinone oxidoreductase subunit 5 (subunit L)/multisubunit Na+/H+ antiporter MnhA subunit